MNYEWIGKPIRTKSDPKNRKKIKNQSESSACEQKTTCSNTVCEQKTTCSNKVNFVQTPFSHSTLNLEQIFLRHKATAFSLHFVFQRDQNHYSDLTSKIIKIFEQILQKPSQKNSGIDSKEKIAHTYEQTTRTTIVKTKTPQMP